MPDNNYCNCPNCRTDNCPNAESYATKAEHENDTFVMADIIRLRKVEAEQREEIEKLRAALETIANDEVSVPCDDPQCGDSTWDHDCTAGSRKPSRLADIARTALTKPQPSQT